MNTVSMNTVSRACLAGFLLSSVAVGQEVAFPDPALDTLIRSILKQKQEKTDKITPTALAKIYFLHGNNRGIADLTGLEHCPNLAEVRLAGNRVTSVAPLAKCIRIQSLDLSRNQIQDISPLGKLVRLQYLKLDGNAIRRLEPLTGLTALGSLYLDDNRVASLKPLQKLPRLHSLYAARNGLTSLEGLRKLKWLANLDVSGNKLTDIGEIESLSELRWTFLQENDLRDISPLIRMAQADVNGQRRFAPYWRLYLAKNPQVDERQITQLRELGVRLDTEYVHRKRQGKETKEPARQQASPSARQ